MDNANEVAHALDGIAGELDYLTPAELLELGHAATTMILVRTKGGLDVDGKTFEPYSEEYAKQREAHGLSTKPDLAVTGHMLGALLPKVSGADEVIVMVTNPLEAVKLSAHNDGVDSSVSVRPHRRNTYVNIKSGRRVSAEEVRRDRRRKNKRTAARQESVSSHARRQRTPKREILDVRVDHEIRVLEEIVGTQLVTRVEKKR